MTITYAPTTYDFGTVAVSSTVTTTISVTNGGSDSVSISQFGSGDFSITSPSAPISFAAGETKTLTISYTPTATGADNATLKTDAVGDTGCALSGNGMTLSFNPTSYAFADTAVSSTAGPQNVVVTYDLGTDTTTLYGPEGDIEVTNKSMPLTLTGSGTVTLTLSFTPSASGTYSATIKTDIATADTCAVTGTSSQTLTTTSDTDGYTEGSYSVDKTYLTLEVTDFNGTGTTTINGYSVSGGLTSYLSLGARNSDRTGERGYEFEQMVSEFVDDTRNRGTSSDPYYRISNANRATESGKLYTRGGWRDHTDGNRVTTTRGDKVEVIGGNYKLIVMGRRQWKNSTNSSTDTSGALHWESSGGITYLYDQVPGQVVDVRWVQDLDGVFRVKEECQKGHVITRYDGTVKEWAYGDVVETRVGSMAAYDANQKSVPSFSSLDAESGYPDALDNASYDDFPKDPAEAHGTSDDFPPTTEYENLVNDDSSFVGYVPDIIETSWANSSVDREWAQQIYERKGTAGLRVPNIKEYDYADKIDETLDAYTIDKKITIRTDTGADVAKLKEYIGSVDGHRGTQKLWEKRTAEYTGHYDGDAVEVWGLAISGGFGLNFGETFFGGFQSFRFGLSLTLFFGFTFDLHILQPLTWDIEVLTIMMKVIHGTCHAEFIIGHEKDIKSLKSKYHTVGAEVAMVSRDDAVNDQLS